MYIIKSLNNNQHEEDLKQQYMYIAQQITSIAKVQNIIGAN